MKQKTIVLSLLAILLFTFHAWAQPTITAAVHLPLAGDTMVRTIMSVPGFTPGASGPGQTFAFTGATPNGSVETGLFSLENGPGAWSYNLRADIDDGGIGYVEFFKASVDSLANSGFDKYIPDLTPFERHNPSIKFPFPFAYGGSFRDTYAGRHASVGGPIDFVGTVDVEADAWGDIILGLDTVFNVLRIHTIDTLQETIFGAPVLVRQECYEYYSNAIKFPVLSACTDPQNGNAYNFYSALRNMSATAVTPDAGPKISLYPNPFQGHLKLEAQEAGVLKIMDLQGRIVAERAILIGLNELDFVGLVAGVYVAVVKGDGGDWERVVVRE